MSDVLDSSAILAVVFGEPGAERVRKILPDSVMSAVQKSEVVTKLVDEQMSEPEIREVLMPFEIGVIEHDGAQAWQGGLLRRDTRPLGLSLGDRACLALGRTRNDVVVTAEKRWAELDIGIDVEVIR